MIFNRIYKDRKGRLGIEFYVPCTYREYKNYIKRTCGKDTKENDKYGTEDNQIGE